MFKKLSVFILSLCIFCMGTPATAEPDGRLALLSGLGIMQGDPDGSFRLSDPLKRAEFTKVAVAASEHRKYVGSAMAISPFSDVPHSLWSAPYIALAAQHGYVNGYLDSTFRPENTVTYAEAVAVCLRLLGYDTQDFGGAWPQGPMEIANAIGLTEGIALSYDAPIARGDTVTLLCNLLDENRKGTSTPYLSLLDCSSHENVVLQATAEEDSAVPSDKAVTTAGTFKKGKTFSSDWVGKTGKLYIENGDTIAAFVPRTQTIRTYTVTGTAGNDLVLGDSIYNWEDSLPVYYKSKAITYGQAHTEAASGDTFTLYCDASGAVEYGFLLKATPKGSDVLPVKTVAVYSVLSDGIITYKNGTMEKIDLADGVTLYKDDLPQGTLLKSQLKMGDILRIVYDSSGRVDYVALQTEGIEGPFTVENTDWSNLFSLTPSTRIMRNGEKVSASDIERYDILYYSKALDMVLAYTDKITGVYKSASPSKDAPSAVNISGVTYSIEGINAFHKLAGGGTFSYGDTLTVLLGRNGGIADVVESTADSRVVGFVTATGTASYKTALGQDYTGYSITLTRPDGKTLSFETDRDYKSYQNRVVTLSFTDGKASASPLNPTSISGKIHAGAYTLGSLSISPTVQIIDTYTPTSSGSGMAESVFLNRLDGVRLSTGQVLYAGHDSHGRISSMILKDVTGDMHRYGVVTRADSVSMDMHVSGSYAFVIDGQSGAYQASGAAFSVSSGMPAKFTYADGKINSISSLHALASSVKEIHPGYILCTDGNRYDISEAQIYTHDTNFTYTKKQPEDVETGYALRAFYDKAPAEGGKIRILLATKSLQ